MRLLSAIVGRLTTGQVEADHGKLHAAAQLGYQGEAWPKPYLAGRDQLHRLAVRTEPAAEKV